MNLLPEKNRLLKLEKSVPSADSGNKDTADSTPTKQGGYFIQKESNSCIHITGDLFSVMDTGMGFLGVRTAKSESMDSPSGAGVGGVGEGASK